MIGIFTIAQNGQRRDLIRNTLSKGRGVHYYFILGDSGEPRDARLGWELATFNDIIILPIHENMNDGKTLKFFEMIFDRYNEVKPFQFVLKMDDDSVLSLPRLLPLLDTLPTANTYFGLDCPTHICAGGRYFTGMGYGVTWDLVRFFKFYSYNYIKVNNHEDQETGYWVQRYDETVEQVNYHDVGREFFHDHISSNSPFSAEITIDTILVHKCRSDELYIDAFYQIN